MNIERNETAELTLQLTLTLSGEDYAPDLKRKLNEAKRNADIKGFRKGMAPMGLIQKLYGEQSLYEVINGQVGKALDGFIRENGIKVVGEPLSSEDQPQNEWKAGSDFVFKFDIGYTKPLDLSISSEDVLPLYKIGITDLAREEMKSNMLRQMGSMQEGEAAGEDDYVIADLTQGETRVEGTYISIRSVEGAARDLFLGAKVGDQFDINVNEAFTNETDRAAMLKMKKEDLSGIDPTYGVTIVNVKTFVSASESQEVYDALFGEDKVHSSEEFAAAVDERLAENYRQEASYRLSKDVKDYLLKKAAVELPEAFLKRWILHVNEGKYSAEEVDKEFPKIIEDFRWQIVREFLQEKYSLGVDEEDLLEAATGFAAYQYSMYGMSGVPEDMLKSYAKKLLEDPSQRRRFEDEVADQKVIYAVRAEITTEEKEVSVEEFRAL